nr:hypothetical protein Iba_chr12fCG9540 [Ipomoea batatas]
MLAPNSRRGLGLGKMAAEKQGPISSNKPGTGTGNGSSNWNKSFGNRVSNGEEKVERFSGEEGLWLILTALASACSVTYLFTLRLPKHAFSSSSSEESVASPSVTDIRTTRGQISGKFLRPDGNDTCCLCSLNLTLLDNMACCFSIFSPQIRIGTGGFVEGKKTRDSENKEKDKSVKDTKPTRLLAAKSL